MTTRQWQAALFAVVLGAAACSSDREATVDSTVADQSATTAATESVVSSAVTETSTVDPTGGAPSSEAHGVGDPLFPDAGAAGLDVRHYDLVIDATDGGFQAVATIDVTIIDPALDEISFDFVGPTVTSVDLNGADVPFNQTDIEINIASDGSAESTVTIVYAGVPEPLDAGIGFSLVGWQSKPWGSFVVSEPTGAATWFPANDHPSDKATFTMAVTVDEGQTAVGPGPLLPFDGTTFHFAPSDPLAPYLMSLVIGEFEVTETVGASGVPIKTTTHVLVPDRPQDLDQMVLDLEALFGPYPFDSYGVVVVPEYLGFALENQTLSLFDLDTYRSRQIHVHEIAHQWFGNYLSPAEWDDIWLNEGFATWVDTWWSANGDYAAFDRLIAEVPANFLGPLRPTNTQELFGTSVYIRGGLTLEALRRTIGQESFEAFVQEWLRRYGGGSASTEDFIALVNELHGGDAATLVTEWVESEAVPSLPPL